MAQVKIDKKAPNFSLVDFNGIPFSLSDFEDKNIVLLIFNRGFT